MTRTMINIDERLLSTAAEVLGTKTKRATVEAALRQVTAPKARKELAELMAAGDLTDHRELRRQAWRTEAGASESDTA
jgi:Arc/MetJ family transcription regulator